MKDTDILNLSTFGELSGDAAERFAVDHGVEPARALYEKLNRYAALAIAHPKTDLTYGAAKLVLGVVDRNPEAIALLIEWNQHLDGYEENLFP